jgi:coproporphyrinogen III oxidase-like Fe-S oxidoreductase
MSDTAADLIRKIGDTLTELDMLAAKPELTHAEFIAVRRERRALDKKQLELVKATFRENTKAFQNASAKVTDANEGLKETIADVTKVSQTLASVSVLISAVEKVVSIAIP